MIFITKKSFRFPIQCRNHEFEAASLQDFVELNLLFPGACNGYCHRHTYNSNNTGCFYAYVKMDQ
jgi:hypothetical protein